MANKVRGITIEIDADTKKFNSQIKSLSAETRATQKELDSLQKGLELEFDAAKFKRAQELAQQVLDQTAQKATALKERMKALEKAGAVDSDEYLNLQRQLTEVDTAALKAKNQVEKIDNIKLNAITGQIDKVAAGLNKASQMAKPFSMAAGGVIAGLGGLGLAAVKAGDDLGTTATQMGISAEALQKMQYIALQTDVDMEKLNKGFIKTRATLADMATGTVNNATKSLEKLGLDFSKFENSDEAFYGVIDALSNMDNELEMTAIANEIFGDKIANEMIPIIKAGGGAIGELGAEFEQLGGLTNEQVAALGGFDNVMNKIKTQLKNIALQFGVALLPIMEKFAAVISEQIVPKLEQLASWFSSLSTEQLEFGLKALAAVAMLAPLLGMLSKLAGGISGIIGLLGKGGGLSKALDALVAHPIIAIIGVIALIVMLLYTTNEKFRESINALIGTISGALAPLLDVIMNTLGTLISLLSPIITMVGDILANALNILMNALSPVFSMLSMLFGLLQPLINIALLPLQMALMALQVPLQLIGALLNWIMPIFNTFATVIQGVFGFVIKIINTVLGWVETGINWVIDKINGLIRGINNLGGWLGIHIDEIATVKLQLETAVLDNNKPDTAVDTGGAPKPEDYTPQTPTYPYDGIDPSVGGGTTNNNTDNSTHNTEQHITVTIENYAAEADIDDMVRQINMKLAEAM